MSSCISTAIDEGKDQDQAVAMCSSMWSSKSAKESKDITDNEDMWDCVASLMDTGLDEDTATEWCMNMMQNTNKPTIVKTTVSPKSKGMEFILSDETIDRYGDVIKADGWDLTNFKKNPIALFGHRADFPIGTWENISTKGGELRGHLKIAPEGTSARIDEIRKLIEAGILKAVSVGFHPLKSKPRSKSAPGELYVKSALAEVLAREHSGQS